MIKNKKIIISVCLLVILLVFALTGILAVSSGKVSAETVSTNSVNVINTDLYNKTFLFPYAKDKVAYLSYTQGSEYYADKTNSWAYYTEVSGDNHVMSAVTRWSNNIVSGKYQSFNIPSVLNGSYTNIVFSINLFNYLINYYIDNVGGDYPYRFGYYYVYSTSSQDVYRVDIYHTGKLGENNVKIQIVYLIDNTTYDLYYTTSDELYNCFYFSNCLPADDFVRLTYRMPNNAPLTSYYLSASTLPADVMRTQFMSLMTHNEKIQVGIATNTDIFASSYVFGYLSSNLGEGFIYDTAYKAGYDAAKEDNQKQYNLGYENGYKIALANQGKYTFTGLLGAVVKAPITALIGEYNSDTGKREGGLLTFELLGYDMSNFFMSLVSVCVIIAVIRLFI